MQSRIGLAAQPISAAQAKDDILYRECLARFPAVHDTAYVTRDFIIAAEEAGAALSLDSHVVSMVLDQLSINVSFVLGCNLSASAFASTESWGVILKQLQARAFLLPRLVVELTETREIPDPQLFTRIVKELHDLGCRVALDDFGTGFASPRLLQLADFDIVKIDKAFLRDSRRSPDGQDSLWHMVQLASCFSRVVVVEGIASAEQEAYACEAGAMHLQGYLLARPCPIGRPFPPVISIRPHSRNSPEAPIAHNRQ